VLVTGGSGLVGKAIEYVIEHEPAGSRFGKRPGERWIFVGSRDADLRDPEQTLKLFEKHQPTHVIHLAALVGGLFANRERKLTFLRDNMLINDNILHTAHIKGTQKVVSCLSTCVFPDKVDYPLTEEKIHLGPPHNSHFGYAHAKRMVDVQNRAYKDEFGCNFTSAVPTNVFGPHDNYDLQHAHVMPALIHKCYLAQKNGTPFRVMGDGTPLRQFIYSRDLAKLFIWQLREYDSVEPVILSVAKEDEISIRDLANSIVKVMNYQGTAIFENEAGDNGQDRKPASNEKLMKLIGPDFKFTPFEEALEESVSWFLENYANARIGQSTGTH